MQTTNVHFLLFLGLTLLWTVPVRTSAQTDAETNLISPLPVHLLDAKHVSSMVNPNNLPDSLWLSSHQVINTAGGDAHLAIFDTRTARQTPLDLVNILAKQQEEFFDIFALRLSPDGHWLLWPGGSKAKPTWVAVSLDEQERREWPRTTVITGPCTAWMQDGRHWVEMSASYMEIGAPAYAPHPTAYKVRVYDTQSDDVQEFPLTPDPSDPGFTIWGTDHLTFTRDGHAWLCHTYSGCKALEEFGSGYDSSELIPGPFSWTLHASTLEFGPEAKLGSTTECVRSPDDSWLLWKTVASGGRRLPQLVLARIDGSHPQVIYTDTTDRSFDSIQWTPDSQHITFFGSTGLGITGMYQITLTKLETEINHQSPTSDQIADRVKTSGKFPVAHPQPLLVGTR